MPEPGVQRQVEPEEEETLQSKPLADKITPLVQVQRKGEPEEEEEMLQAKPLAEEITPLVQRHVEPEEEEEELQAKKSVVSPSINRFIPLENSSNNIIQRWGVSDHEELTGSVTNKTMTFFEGFEIDKNALETFKGYSTEMNRRFPAIYFNLPAVIISSHDKLTKHYMANSTEAQNHGEGGLYSYDLAKAKGINLAHQKKYEDKARKSWEMTQRKFSSFDECFRIKKKGRLDALNSLGYALHIAQDRGSHGEGAIGNGHDRPDFKPDNPGVNKEGWKQAQQNTELAILRSSDILYKLLDNRWSRTCSYTTTPKVRVTGK
jgi:hypothetical protein